MRGWQTALIFGLYALPNVGGLVMMKYGLTIMREMPQSATYFGPRSSFVLIGGALYVLSFLIWLAILARYELSQAYPVAIGLTLVLSSLASSILLGESLTLIRILGILFVFAGIWMVAQ